MEALILVALGAVIAYVILSARQKLQESRTEEEETDDFTKLLHYKRRIINTSAYSE